MTKIARSGSASGSISKRHGSSDPDPDPDTPQNVMDPQHCCTVYFYSWLIVCTVLPQVKESGSRNGGPWVALESKLMPTPLPDNVKVQGPLLPPPPPQSIQFLDDNCVGTVEREGGNRITFWRLFSLRIHGFATYSSRDSKRAGDLYAQSGRFGMGLVLVGNK